MIFVIDTASAAFGIIVSLMIFLGLGIIGIKLYNRNRLEGYRGCAYSLFLLIYLFAVMLVFMR